MTLRRVHMPDKAQQSPSNLEANWKSSSHKGADTGLAAGLMPLYGPVQHSSSNRLINGINKYLLMKKHCLTGLEGTNSGVKRAFVIRVDAGVDVL